VERAIGEVEGDARAMEAVQAVVEMYGEGLARIVARVDSAALLDDELVSHLLLVHDLHPLPVEERVRAVIGDRAELVSVSGGVVRIRVDRSCDDEPAALDPKLEDAILAVAPDAEEVVAEESVRLPVLQIREAAT